RRAAVLRSRRPLWRTRVIRFAALLGIACSALFAYPASAKEGSATAAVRAANEKLRTALDGYVKAKGDERKAAREQVRAAVDSLLDFNEIVRAATGKHW